MPSFSESQWRAIQERQAAEVDGLRRVLAQSQARIAMLESDLRTATEMLQESRADAVCAAVPWGVIDDLLIDWQLGNYASEDAIIDLHAWRETYREQVTA